MLKKASPIGLFLRNEHTRSAPDGPEIVRSAEWPTLGALIPQAVDSATMEIVLRRPRA